MWGFHPPPRRHEDPHGRRVDPHLAQFFHGPPRRHEDPHFEQIFRVPRGRRVDPHLEQFIHVPPRRHEDPHFAQLFGNPHERQARVLLHLRASPERLGHFHASPRRREEPIMMRNFDVPFRRGEFPMIDPRNEDTRVELRHVLCTVCRQDIRAINVDKPEEFRSTCSPECGNIFMMKDRCAFCGDLGLAVKSNGDITTTCCRICDEQYRKAYKCSEPECFEQKEVRCNETGWRISCFCIKHSLKRSQMQ